MKCGHRIVTILIKKQYKHDDDPVGMCDEGWSWKKAPWTSIRTECITNVSPVQLFYSRVIWHRGRKCCPTAVTSILKVKIFSMTFIGPGAKRKLLCDYVVCMSVRPWDSCMLEVHKCLLSFRWILPAASQHKRITYTNCCIYRVVLPDDEQ